jgi:tetratricopeptide (TPR) repeat protein
MSVNSLSPIEINALMEQAVAYFRSGQLQYAEPMLRDILGRRKSWCPALNLLSIICLQSQRMDEGLALMTKSLKVDPRQPQVHHNRGLALHRLGRHDQAIASFDRAIQLNPGYAEACCNRAIALADQGRFDPAIAGYDRAIALKPDYAVAHYNRAIALEKLRRYAESLISYDSAIAVEPALAKAHCNRGGILETLGQMTAPSHSILLCLMRRTTKACWNY